MASATSVRQRSMRVALAKTPEDKATAYRDLAAERIALYVERVVAEAPPLTDEQRARIANLLAGGEDS